MSNQIYLGFSVSSRSTNRTTTAQFRDIGNVTGAITGTQVNPHESIGPSSRTTPIVFSEIMWKPADRSDGKNLEFIEIYNSNPWFQDISGYKISCADMNYTFPPNTVIPGGAFFVIAAAPNDMQSVYGISNVFGPYAGSLKKSEELTLLDERGAVLLTVPYEDSIRGRWRRMARGIRSCWRIPLTVKAIRARGTAATSSAARRANGSIPSQPIAQRGHQRISRAHGSAGLRLR
ncbi:MAG: lamin tail domain-containing protein [Limisphaerales bacterium]